MKKFRSVMTDLGLSRIDSLRNKTLTIMSFLRLKTQTWDLATMFTVYPSIGQFAKVAAIYRDSEWHGPRKETKKFHAHLFASLLVLQDRLATKSLISLSLVGTPTISSRSSVCSTSMDIKPRLVIISSSPTPSRKAFEDQSQLSSRSYDLLEPVF